MQAILELVETLLEVLAQIWPPVISDKRNVLMKTLTLAVVAKLSSAKGVMTEEVAGFQVGDMTTTFESGELTGPW